MWIGTQLQSVCLNNSKTSTAYSTQTFAVTSGIGSNTFSLGDKRGFDAASASQGFANCNFVATKRGAFDAQAQQADEHEQSRLNLSLHRRFSGALTSRARRAA